MIEIDNLPPLTPLETVIEAHPHIRAEYKPGTFVNEQPLHTSDYSFRGKLPDGRDAVVILDVVPVDNNLALITGHKPQIIITGFAFDQSEVEHLTNGDHPDADSHIESRLNEIKIEKCDDSSLISKTELAPGSQAIEAQDVLFIALNGLTLLDTFERFTSADEQSRALKNGLIGPYTRPFYQGIPRSIGSQALYNSERKIDDVLVRFAEGFSGSPSEFRTSNPGDLRPLMLRHILKQVVFQDIAE